MEDLQFNADGSIKAYKTSFFKQIIKDSSKDTVSLIQVGQKQIAFCFDEDGHACDICFLASKEFLEFKKDNLIRICKNCSNEISANFAKLRME